MHSINVLFYISFYPRERYIENEIDEMNSENGRETIFFESEMNMWYTNRIMAFMKMNLSLCYYKMQFSNISHPPPSCCRSRGIQKIVTNVENMISLVWEGVE